MSSDEQEGISLKLNDAGQFAYAGLVAVSLSELHSSQWHRKYTKETLKNLLDHLECSKQLRDSMFALLGGQGSHDVDPLIHTLQKNLTNDCSLIIQDLIKVALVSGSYDARFRVLIHHVAWLLKVDQTITTLFEDKVIKYLEEHNMSEEEKNERRDKAKRQKRKRYLLIGLATVGGGALIGLTGGLAAPLVAAGAGAVIGGAGAAALGSMAGVYIIGSLFGVAGAGLTGYKMKKRVGAIEEFEFKDLTKSKQLHIVIAVTGWLTEKHKDVETPWQQLAVSKEQYCLQWESRYLLEMGQVMEYFFSAALSVATQEALKQTVLAGLLSAIIWPASLLTLSNVIDNPWSVCLSRAAQTGKQLADVLISREHGKRPVTLIGFSLGARVIFFCLKEMSKRSGSEGIIEDAILMGTPATGDEKEWQSFERVVAGKIYNGYCRGDWLLKYLYRTTSISMKISGLAPVKWHNRRMFNVDLSDVVSGHMDYFKKMNTILHIMGIPVRDRDIPCQDTHVSSGSDSHTDMAQMLTDHLSTDKVRKVGNSENDTEQNRNQAGIPKFSENKITNSDISRDINNLTLEDTENEVMKGAIQ